ncbi:MAG: sensor histidine kinase [Flavobacteriales bacterium]|nr:sensor histidine kinase [Flavobacteriales bacterium]
MTRKQLTNIAIVVAIAVTWLLFAGLVVFGLLTDRQRTIELGGVALERVMEGQHARLSLALHTMEQDLRKEAAYIAVHDSLTESALKERWQPIMEIEWAISSIAVATENGSEHELARLDGHWRFSTTTKADELPLLTEWSLNDPIGGGIPRIGELQSDPRKSLWFGQALGDRGSDPVWSITTNSDSTEALHVALLVRADRPTMPYRVVRFTLAPERLIKALGQPISVHTELYMSQLELPWLRADTGTSALVMTKAITNWSAGKQSVPFSFEVSGSEYLARIGAFSAAGMQIYTGAVLPLDKLKKWTAGQRNALKVAACLLLVLGVLMTWVLMRSRRTDRIALRQERKSLTQERKLAKVTSEREILDREVHHRVKNNLQVVSSILNLQADRITDTQAKTEYMRGKRRIDSMALVHHKLYAQTDLRNIDLSIFITQVANAMKAMFEPESRSVSHSVDTAGLKLNADTSIQVGIILCELLTNCYKHAFPYVTGGHIEIRVRKEEQDVYRLNVKDNGKGLLRDPDKAEAELGLELVEALADQIDGRMEISTENGTNISITFRMQGDGSMRKI